MLIGLAVALLLVAGPRVQRGYEALLFLADLAGHKIPALLDHRPPAAWQTVAFTQDGHRYQADLYQTLPPPRARILLIHGAVADGRDNPRLRRFAITLARSGFAVMVPDIPSLKGLRLTPETIQEIGHSLHHLLDQPAPPPESGVGMAAISVAVGPALIAALQPELRDRVHFLLAIGGYYDLPRLLGYHTTGHYRTPGNVLQQTPNEYAKWVFVLSHLHHLESPVDRNLLRTLAYRRMDDPQAPATDLIALLGPAGRMVHDFVDNRDPADVSRLISQLPTSIQSDISALDLAHRDLMQIRGRTILVHGLDDHVIPAAESQALALALPPERTHLSLVDGLQHVDTEASTLDIWRLWQAIDTLLAERPH
jgi:dienelactone hydrolase